MCFGFLVRAIFESLTELFGRRAERTCQLGQFTGSKHKQHNQQDNQPFLSSQSNPP